MKTRNEFLLEARTDGLNRTTAELCYQYMVARDFELDFPAEWIRRFSLGMEWQNSDYAGRRVLQKLAPTIYPTDLDEYYC